ncbi:MAG: PqqD family protein [Phycisphaerales bacterium]|nr:PqqD family protein [Phycisphaerae bacterium]NNF44735.1 PqqD family protein [Phycisphaerales bacterium]NNM27659.1 PqqD family protein [Phycisphaerales bacterium]
MRPPSWTSCDAEIVVPPRRDDLMEETLDGELIFSDPNDGSVFHLNDTAIAVWRHCDGRTNTHAIAAAFTQRWEVTPDVALDDVEQVVTLLAESGLLQTKGRRS